MQRHHRAGRRVKRRDRVNHLWPKPVGPQRFECAGERVDIHAFVVERRRAHRRARHVHEILRVRIRRGLDDGAITRAEKRGDRQRQTVGRSVDQRDPTTADVAAVASGHPLGQLLA